LGDIVQPLPGLTPVLPPEVATLLKRQIVDQAADARELPEQDFLFGSRGKLVAEAAKDHSVAIGLRLDTMGANTDIRKGRHVVYALHAHLVFVTKYRRDALSQLAIGDLRPVFAKVCKDFEAELIECDGEDDHVHLLIVYATTNIEGGRSDGAARCRERKSQRPLGRASASAVTSACPWRVGARPTRMRARQCIQPGIVADLRGRRVYF
jgi:putative transposase